MTKDGSLVDGRHTDTPNCFWKSDLFCSALCKDVLWVKTRAMKKLCSSKGFGWPARAKEANFCSAMKSPLHQQHGPGIDFTPFKPPSRTRH